MQTRSATGTTVDLLGQEMVLLPEKAIYWAEPGWLMLADLHIGKAGHFRKHGLPILPGGANSDLARLGDLVRRWHPSRVLILGDLFHSRINAEWQLVGELIAAHPSPRWTLIKGNHDILPAHRYQAAGIETLDSLTHQGLLLTHEPAAGDQPNLYGHLHPGIRLKGKARQSLSLPCFWWSRQAAVLPAFGSLTGLFHIQPLEGDRIAAISGEEIFLF